MTENILSALLKRFQQKRFVSFFILNYFDAMGCVASQFWAMNERQKGRKVQLA